jgi:hypothetical protein
MITDDLLPGITKVNNATSSEELANAVINLVTAIVNLLDELRIVVPEIINAILKIPGYIADSVLDDANELFKRLIDHLIQQYLREVHSQMFSVLWFLGILDIKETEKDIKVDIIHWERIPNWLGQPGVIFDTVYGWKSKFDVQGLLERIEVITDAFSLPGGIYLTDRDIRANLGNANYSHELRIPLVMRSALPEFDSEFGISISPTDTGIALYPYFYGNLDIVKEIAENWLFSLEGSIEPKDAGLCIKLRAPHDLELVTSLFAESPSHNFIGTFEVGLTRTSSPDSMIYIFGSDDGSHLALKEASVKFKADSQRDTPELSAKLNLKDFTIAINPGADGDGFIQKLLSGINIKSVSELGIGVSNVQGIFFEGSSALEIKIPTHLKLGPLNIDYATFGINIDDRDFGILLASDFSVSLGPLYASVEHIGLTIPLSFPENGNGNLGPVQISAPKFMPPKGVSLSLDAGVVKGAGYLFIDADRGEYAGALELTFQDFLSLKAIGLIATKMPDGSKGFSLLIIITAEFTIPLGMGFVFLGAGGLLGLHRTAKLEPRAEGVRSGATANILFPTNVVENAPKIISDIKIFFPIQENHFLIGPMIKLGYGQPALISLALGIIIEIKTDEGGGIERIAILGVIKCILPEEKAAILVLQVNFIGAVDFTTKTGFFFAAVFESRILSFTIEGEMGVLIAWGSNSNFLLSVGGFHPMFNPPPLPFPVPKRMALSILNESWGKIRVEGYFAITTNTVQFGAKIEVFFGIDDFKIDGHLAFDALFQFDPFYFIIEISGKVSLKVCGFDLFTISLKLSLEGPTPWRARGKGKIKILFFSFTASFDKKWGKSQNTQLPPISVIPILETEFGKSQNWEAIAPTSNSLLVSLRELPKETSQSTDQSTGIIVLHPVGSIKVSQRAVPLGIAIDKIGNQKPADGSVFTLDELTDTDMAFSGEAQESFAPGQFFEMGNSKKLSEPATRKYNSGKYVTPTGIGITTACIAVRHVRYDLFTIDTAYRREPTYFFQTLQILFRSFLHNNAAAKSTRSSRTKKESQPFAEQISVKQGSFTVAYTMNNEAFNGRSSGFSSQWEAEAYIAANPNVADQLHVIPANEVNVPAI